MPIYEYRCASCNSKFELLRSLSQANQGADCPCCHSPAERVLSTFRALTKDGSGQTSSIGGGSSCASCGSASCTSCGL